MEHIRIECKSYDEVLALLFDYVVPAKIPIWFFQVGFLRSQTYYKKYLKQKTISPYTIKKGSIIILWRRTWQWY
jgi:hypothetical protein